jgi:hypothetical protein
VIKSATRYVPRTTGCPLGRAEHLACGGRRSRCWRGPRDDLEAKITAFTIRHDKNARPYKWSYDADAEHARYLERHPQPEAAPGCRQPPDSNARRPRPSQDLATR